MIGSYKLIIAGINIPFITRKREESFSFFFLYFFFIKKKEKRSFVQKTEREEHVLLWEEDYSIRNAEKRERVYSYSRTRIFKRTDTVSQLLFKKKILSLPSELSSFFEFSLSCPSTQEDLLVATPPRVKINLSLQNFLSFSDIYPSLVFYPFSFLKEGKKKIRRRTFIYYTFSLVKR